MNTELLETYTQLPPQQQIPPGEQEKMVPKPVEEDLQYVATGKLKGKVAIITGGDSGIGRRGGTFDGSSFSRVFVNYPAVV